MDNTNTEQAVTTTPEPKPTPSFTTNVVGDTTNVVIETSSTVSDTITPETFKAVEDHNSAYLADTAKHAADIATGIMQKDKSVSRVVLVAPFTTAKTGKVEFTTDRPSMRPGVCGKPEYKGVTFNMKVVTPSTKLGGKDQKSLKDAMIAAIND